ncbi:hypothetical protein QJS10_CPB13g01540 [Acorus calamus]|uniref:Kinesin-like protein n=1 Tax=Acorus calamus TaxID=4465 RepID=A0AAV9DIX8_ACOCL|nr:hypothetical protein QJS10_CPB13g01540 [Acorus calamus]
MSKEKSEKAVNVQVLLRCRPFNEDELRNNAPQVVTCNEYQREVAVSQSIAGKQIDRVFTFDKVFGPSAQQKDLYDQAVIPIVNEVLDGFNCTIFAYGQTGTGKTYTMEGECKRAKSGPNGQLPPDAGVIPRAVKQIFDTLESQNAEYSVKVTFLELYNEEITDLLGHEEISKVILEEKQKKTLPLMEDGKGGVLVRGLEEEIVTSANEIFTLLERGSSKRRTAETLLNKQSSRSHSLFSITIHIKEATPEGEELIKCGKLNLVDLAGSENISRSGAREGRAREAGEINKSLLTLGRVITALVEHLGHIPYRDSKLTRLLRDSLGGRTKTCIIATVSPSVHCLDETLSTLDYAHRAKNIKNRPEVNQKLMKSTLIKDLYSEIDRMKAEVYAAREKNGVYIPKERYYQEESERKAMADQIENNQKQFEELQAKLDAQIQLSSDLGIKLNNTEKNLDQTCKLLATAKEDIKAYQYSLTEKDFIIAEQKKAAREARLSAANRSVVNGFQADLAEKIGSLSSIIVASMARQNEQLQCVEKLCHSCLEVHDKSATDLKDKVAATRVLYISHIEAMRNMVHLNKAGIKASVEDMSSMVSSNFSSLGQPEHTSEMSKFIVGLLDKIEEETQKLDCHAARTHEAQTTSIADFQKAYEEQTQFETEKLLADLTNLVSNHMQRQKELVCLGSLNADLQLHSNFLSNGVTGLQVDVRLVGLRDASIENKAFLDEHKSIMECATSDAKRKWQAFSAQAENHSKDSADFSAAKHCRMELLLQQCVNTVDGASKHWKKTHESINEMSSEHVTAVEAIVRNAVESSEQHDLEVGSSGTEAMENVVKNSDDIRRHIDRLTEHETEAASGIIANVKTHLGTLKDLEDNHAGRTTDIVRHTQNTFQNTYMDNEPSGDTPTKSETDVPSKGMIELLRSQPMEALLEEFRENNPYESSKEPKPSLIPRSPLIQLN